MKTHLAKHNIFENSGPEDLGEGSSETKQHSIASIFQSRAEYGTRALLEQNILRWVVTTDDMAFTAIESPAFQHIFKDSPDAPLPFSSQTVVRRIDADFDRYRI